MATMPTTISAVINSNFGTLDVNAPRPTAKRQAKIDDS
jgi:hypothetical protein